MFRRSDFNNRRNNEPPRENRSSSLLDQHGRIMRHYLWSPDDTGGSPLLYNDDPKLRSLSRRKADENSGTKASQAVKKLQPVVEKAKREIKFLPEVEEEIKLPPLDLKCQKRRHTDEDSVTKPAQPKRWHRMMVDIMPGLRAPLIGVKESLEAYRTDRCFHTACSECDTFLYCIKTADLVLCPQCKAISPAGKHLPALSEDSVILGIGITVDHVLADPECPQGHF